MKEDDITWAPLIPLIGGQMIGCEQALGKPPVAIYSYDGFQSNDSHYVNYMNNIRKNNLEYIILDESTQKRSVDIISGTPPLNVAA